MRASMFTGIKHEILNMDRLPYIGMIAALLVSITGRATAQSPATTGTITTYAGIGVVLDTSAPNCNRFNPCFPIGTGFSGDGGPAISAMLNEPYGVAVDAAGNVFIADSHNARIRKVTPAGVISTVAGNVRAGFSGDGGPGTSASLLSPQAIAVDA